MFLKSLTVCFSWNFSLIIRGDFRFYYKTKTQFNLHNWQNFFLQNHGNFEEWEKISSSSERNTGKYEEHSVTKHTWSGDGSRVHLLGVSEEIEGRVIKKPSKEFSRTESRILGALSRLDEFLLNPQVRTCSVAVPGTSRNNDLENREPTGIVP